jgi:hypothetical protein
MGKYIERTSFGQLNGSYVGKIKTLVIDGADIIPREPEEWTTDLVCVVENPGFTAVAYCYDEQEFKRFSNSFKNGDNRRHIWLIYPKVEKFTGL